MLQDFVFLNVIAVNSVEACVQWVIALNISPWMGHFWILETENKQRWAQYWMSSDRDSYGSQTFYIHQPFIQKLNCNEIPCLSFYTETAWRRITFASQFPFAICIFKLIFSCKFLSLQAAGLSGCCLFYTVHLYYMLSWFTTASKSRWQRLSCFIYSVNHHEVHICTQLQSTSDKCP